LVCSLRIELIDLLRGNQHSPHGLIGCRKLIAGRPVPNRKCLYALRAAEF
jgi:hypothetical protein